MTNVDNTPIAPNAKRLLIAGFMAILAAGVGFAIRGGIFDNWGAEFGFTATELGKIGGAGFSGFSGRSRAANGRFTGGPAFR